jgi:hypothetical protein
VQVDAVHRLVEPLPYVSSTADRAGGRLELDGTESTELGRAFL